MRAVDAARAAAVAARVRTLLDDVARAAGPSTWVGPAADELAAQVSARRAELIAAADDLAGRVAALDARGTGAAP